MVGRRAHRSYVNLIFNVKRVKILICFTFDFFLFYFSLIITSLRYKIIGKTIVPIKMINSFDGTMLIDHMFI